MKPKSRGNLTITVVAVGLLLAGSGWCQPAVEVIEQTAHGRINWSTGMVQAKGTVIPEKPLAQKLGDRQAALAEALRRAWQQLFDTVLQVSVQGDRQVRDLTAGDDVVAAKIREMVKKARVVGKEYLSDGTVAVSVEMSLFGGFSQLVLPSEIKQVQSLKTVGEAPQAPPAGETAPQGASGDSQAAAYSGLVIDARGLGCQPALYPRIIDETGQEIYGSAFVSREFAVQLGMSGYTMDSAAALADPRVAPHPMSVKGLRVPENNPSVIVISKADGARIRSTPEHLSYLKTCDVVIVLE